jgi:hypothetical protein
MPVDPARDAALLGPRSGAQRSPPAAGIERCQGFENRLLPSEPRAGLSAATA